MTQTFTHYGRAFALATLLSLPLVTSAQTSTTPERAISQLAAQRARFGLSEADVAAPAVLSSFTDAHNGVTHAYLRQRHQGVEVFGAVADIHLSSQGRVVAAHSSFVPNIAAAVRATTPALSPVQAIASAARALNMPAPSQVQELQRGGSSTEGLLFSNAGISLENIPVKLMYLPRPSGEIVLVWNVTLYPTDAKNYWDAFVDAQTGQLLERHDLVINEEASFAALSSRTDLPTSNAHLPGFTSPAARTNTPNSYHVWPLTIESPSHGARAVVSNPAHATASPFGWHDTNGVLGPEYTITRGNNVHAYEDRRNRNTGSGATAVGTNNYTPGFNPDGGANLIFDFPIQNTGHDSVDQSAAITNLFYWNNLTHDIMERHGFTEAAGNFQFRNYSGQGRGNDFVQAEAQDGGGMNNANFSTPVDGFQPRMQMYMWNGIPDREMLRVTAPSSLAGFLPCAEASFGPRLTSTPITGRLVLVTTATGTSDEGCSTLSNAAAINGNIAVVYRGNCDFWLKVLNAQQAGARAVVVVNNAATAPIVMGGTPTTPITIPSVMISQADGLRIRQKLNDNEDVSIALKNSGPSRNLDGDFDNGIIAHEYGHGISTRLAGGAANSSCLRSLEQMGEGWSDFFALWMTTKPGDVGTTPRGIGTYASGQPTTGGGIRPKHYSTDFTVNDATYALVGTTTGGVNYNTSSTGAAQVHAIGYIWASTLWDLNWAMIQRHGYNPNLYASTGGNNMCLQLVLDGLKLQACNPGFIDGRNGILKADSINNNAANSDLIWRVFARRGMGAGASQGSSSSLSDQTISYSLPAVLAAKTPLASADVAVFPNPAQERVTVRLRAGGAQPVRLELVNNLGQVVLGTTAAAAQLQREGVELSTAGLPAGLYVVRLSSASGTATHKLVVRH